MGLGETVRRDEDESESSKRKRTTVKDVRVTENLITSFTSLFKIHYGVFIGIILITSD